jgi:hypothetical protein
MTEVSIRQMAQTIADIDARTAAMSGQLERILQGLNTLTAMTARMPDGRTLINVVATILNEVEQD